jgi:tocopherol cyclase
VISSLSTLLNLLPFNSPSFSSSFCSLTTGGGRRALPFLPGAEEDVALIGVHHEGTFIELVPWRGSVEWEVSPWGSWRLRGDNGRYRAEVEATCAPDAGTPLRAPTATEGLAPFCRDTFYGSVRLRVWDKERSNVTPWVDAQSKSCALEVGGGPWWSEWKAKAEMREPLRSLRQLPIEPSPVLNQLPDMFKPPGI